MVDTQYKHEEEVGIAHKSQNQNYFLVLTLPLTNSVILGKQTLQGSSFLK